jgi:hypothetical protein
MNAKSNHTFKMHSQRLDMYDVIRSKKWDYIVLQGFSRELKYDKEQIDTASLPFIKQILDSIYIFLRDNNIHGLPSIHTVITLLFSLKSKFFKQQLSNTTNITIIKEKLKKDK